MAAAKFEGEKKLYTENIKTMGNMNLQVKSKGSKSLRIFQRKGLKLDKDLIFSRLVQNVCVYRMAKSKKI